MESTFFVNEFSFNLLPRRDFQMIALTVGVAKVWAVLYKHYHIELNPGKNIAPDGLPYGWLSVRYRL